MGQGKERHMSKEVNVLAIIKGKERYIFIYSDENAAETLRTLGRFASNQDLSFTWYDAAVSSQKIREIKARQKQQGKNRIKNSFPLPPPPPPIF